MALRRVLRSSLGFRRYSTHFGYETVSENEKGQRVGEVFSNVAEYYDLMNDAMSGGIHRVWKDYFVNKMSPRSDTRLLDVAGGTGDIAFRCLRHMKNSALPDEHQSGEIIVCDINAEMLKVGEKRAKQDGLELKWVQGNAEELPFPENSFDVYSIAYGIRNVTRIQKALEEAFRVLKVGGRFMCLEFSDVQNPIINDVYDWYSFNIIPVTGKLLSGDWKSYQYLVESIRQFPKADDFKNMIEEAGFQEVHYEKLMFGVSAIHSGFKLK
ncbi:unnamed protein product [Dimorphilus gyrociliatus]|uniref:2-methoxy-6-polyprenyl-1,4-benzoquinol methylase, mitochondrial n=1 Tax=Dimorphilus gyrociliatus TaxID=2664684 RepID=A0A7I8W704_9ANNE|nr:unnamed protein product [Dimorphilus gyrociliatus]